MYYGIDENGKRTYIDNSYKEKKYFCPLCNGILIRKAEGKIKAHHFAHKRTSSCDSWEHPGMSEWHKEMQGHFPEKYREKYLTDNGEKHFADVFIKRENGANIVFEFQHSQIKPEEFERRNQFYTYADANTDDQGNIIKNLIIWVFDKSCENQKNNKEALYIDLSDNSELFPSADTRTDNDCVKVLKEHRRIWAWTSYKAKIPEFLDRSKAGRPLYRKDIHINRDIIPEKGLYAQIYWENSNNFFENIKENVFVFFDVDQHKYARIENSGKYMFLNEGLNDNIGNMYRFFIDMSADFHREHAYYLHHNSNHFKGICYPAEYFWSMDAESMPIWIPGK